MTHPYCHSDRQLILRYCWVLSHCTGATPCLSIRQVKDIWTVSNFGWIWIKGYSKWLHTGFCVNLSSFLFSRYQGMEFLGHTVSECLTLKEDAKVFSKWLRLCAFRPAMSESSRCFTSWPPLILSFFFSFDHSNRSVVVSPCGFNLHFPNDQWCWTDVL